MESLEDCGYSIMDNGTKVCHFFQGIKLHELEAVVNVIHAPPENYDTDFDTTMSYLGKMVMKGLIMQSIQIAKNGS